MNFFNSIHQAGRFAAQGRVPAHACTLRTDNLTIGAVLAVSICLVGGVRYFPAFPLGPLLERAVILR